MGLLLAVGLTSSALASFDLLLVLDSGQDVVHRYDGDSGTYLGSFGGGTLNNVRGITVDKASKTAVVTHDNGYSTWDYNTGFFKGYNDLVGLSNNDMSLTSNGRLLMTSTDGSVVAIRRLNTLSIPTGFFSFNSSTTVGPWTSAVEGPGGNYFAVQAGTGDIVQFSSTTSAQLSVVNVPFFIGTSKGASDGTSYVALAASGQAISVGLGGTSALGGYTSPVPFTSAVEFEYAHPGEGWGLGVNASGTRLQRYYRNLGGVSTFMDAIGPGRTLSQVTTPAGLAVVTAPEPGTLIALGVGAAALLRRRRR